MSKEDISEKKMKWSAPLRNPCFVNACSILRRGVVTGLEVKYKIKTKQYRGKGDKGISDYIMVSMYVWKHESMYVWIYQSIYYYLYPSIKRSGCGDGQWIHDCTLCSRATASSTTVRAVQVGIELEILPTINRHVLRRRFFPSFSPRNLIDVFVEFSVLVINCYFEAYVC